MRAWQPILMIAGVIWVVAGIVAFIMQFVTGAIHVHRWEEVTLGKRGKHGWYTVVEKCTKCGQRRMMHYSDCPCDPPYSTELPAKTTWRTP